VREEDLRVKQALLPEWCGDLAAIWRAALAEVGLERGESCSPFWKRVGSRRGTRNTLLARLVKWRVVGGATR